MDTKSFVFAIIGIVVGLIIGFLVAASQSNTSNAIASLQSSVDALQNNIASLESQVGSLTVASAPTIERGTRNVNEAAIVSNYYLVNLADSKAWLDTLNEGEAAVPPAPDSTIVVVDDELIAAFDEDLVAVGETITDGPALLEAIEADESKAKDVLTVLYRQLMQNIELNEGEEVLTCFALEDDLYTGASLYVYLQLPASADLAPATWNQLSAPLEDNMFWTTACFNPDEKEKK